LKSMLLCKCGEPRLARDSSCKACARDYYAKWSAAVNARLLR
jgi:hypothetical protein